ncbi:MAG TPA: hypothetical protein VMV44_05365 [Rectinemataceae bacterium]|nr:hypothetical protein [Rectinemataceae bacterium]
MRRRHAVPALLCLFAVASATSLDWPATAPVSIEFGGPNAGAPIEGLFLSGSGIDIRSAEAGEVTFERNARDGRTRLPSTLGATLVLEGEKGFASVYGYLPAVADPGARSYVAGALIGKSGQAGLLDGPGFLFAMFDRKSDRWVNPRVFLPRLDDAKAPVIRKVSLESKGQEWVLGEQKGIPQGSYSIIVEAAEQEKGISGLVGGPPWYVRVLANGEKVAELKTEIASVKEGRLSFYPDTQDGASLVDANGSIRLPPRAFARGKMYLEVLVRDFAGNERSAGWTLLVE